MNGANAVSWAQYDGVDGFGGGASQEDINALFKALTAGQDVNNPGTAAGVGFPLRIESLERTLRNTTYKMDHVRFWKGIPKLGAFNTVEEYNRISDYGAQGVDAFIAEGDLPEDTDSTYSREVAKIKYMGTTRKVTHVMSLVRPAHGNVLGLETVNGTMYLLRQVEKSLFFGDSRLDDIQWDGFQSLIEQFSPAANIIDLRGQPLSEDRLTDGSLSISDAPNFGAATHLHLNPKTHNDLVKSFYPKARFDQFNKPDDGFVGLDIQGFTSPSGRVRFEPNVFITDGGGVPTAAQGPAATRPGTPTIAVALAAAPSASSQFIADDAGTYRYQIVARNRYGASIAVVVTGSPVTVATGDAVTFSVTEGAPGASWYEVYRSKKNGLAGTERLIKRINRTGVTQVITDNNEDLPGTTRAFMFQQNLECMSFKQLAPMVKIPLATVDTSIRWMQLIYGTPVLYTPGKVVMYKNVGREPGFVGQP